VVSGSLVGYWLIVSLKFLCLDFLCDDLGYVLVLCLFLGELRSFCEPNVLGPDAIGSSRPLLFHLLALNYSLCPSQLIVALRLSLAFAFSVVLIVASSCFGESIPFVLLRN
jgi:hypothetical protein